MPLKLWRVIEPSALKDQAMRLELLNALRRMGTKVRADFRETTKTWSNQPDFSETVQGTSLRGGKAKLEVLTSDPIYTFVSGGTKPHGIAVVNAKTLAFSGTFTAKTVPGVIGSGPGFKGAPDTFVTEVWHPGIEARRFDKAIAEKWRKDFRKEMDTSMAKVRLASGHAL